MLDNTARMLATVGIWVSFAITIVCGPCRMNFNGDGAQVTFLLTVAMLCLAAVVSTGLVWRNSRSTSANNGPTAGQQAV